MRRLAVALACAAFVAAGCSAPGAPRVTFFVDGDSVQAAPLIHCDVRVQECEQGTEPARLRARPGYPVQVSVPAEVSESPWAVIVQYADAEGRPQPEKRQFFSPGTRHAYTATGGGPGSQLLVVEVQQIGAAYAADEAGNPILDEAGNPQLVTRGIWSLQLEPV
ncbi:DUF2771 family protein [Amycolatopsis aidingensis]|uniref:DUF2771 family protein n=1 Tax=Amycolatopsis aidingensis TaxID=2842453 RepID=UPI0038CC188A